MRVPVQRVLLDAPLVFVLMRAQEVLTGPFSLLAPSLIAAHVCRVPGPAQQTPEESGGAEERV